MKNTSKHLDKELNERLAARGFRSTSQRERVYDVLLQERDHPTAEEVFLRAKQRLPDISMATVYNCLAALVKCSLVKQVKAHRGAARFCPNMREHCHFYCQACGSVFDIALEAGEPEIQMPRGFKPAHFDIAIHGLCPDCARKTK